MSKALRGYVNGFALALLLLSGAAARAEKSPADLMPQATPIFVEIAHPADLIDLALNHPLRAKLEESDAWRKALARPDYKTFLQVVHLIEDRAGVEWKPALQQMTGGGVSLGFDPSTQGVLLLARPTDMKTADAVRDALFSLMRDDANNKGLADPISVIDYRDFKAFKTDKLVIADIGPYLVMTNKLEMAKAAADRFLDGGAGLAGDADFSAARKQAADRRDPPTAWIFARMSFLRSAAGKDKFDPARKSENAVAELLAGGLLPIAGKTPYVTASFWLAPAQVRLALEMPSDSSWVGPERKFFFAPPGDGAANPLLPKDTLLSISTYRDISAMWQAGPDLFTEAVATQMAQSDSGLSTVFGGKSFSADVLGSLKPQVQFVVARQDFGDSGRKPSIRLPGAAFVFQVRPERFASVRKTFRLGFQSAVALGNIGGAQKGFPMLDIAAEHRGESDIQYATYSSPDDDATNAAKKPDSAGDKSMQGGGDIYLNFSPSLVISRDYLMLCSTRQIAEQLADLSATAAAKATIPQNTLIQLNAAPIAELIHENRQTLIARNMLEKGHDRAAAEQEIDLFGKIVDYFRSGQISLTSASDSVKLEMELQTK